MTDTDVKEKPIKLTKNQKRRLRKKEHKQESKLENKISEVVEKNENNVVEPIEYVSDIAVRNEMAQCDELKNVLAKFISTEDLMKNINNKRTHQDDSDDEDKDTEKETKVIESNDSLVEKPQEEVKLSKKKRKMLKRLTVAQLKQIVDRPDVVEECDVTAQNPLLLIYLKSYRNTVKVPRHWSNKRRYLSTKRGSDKIPYQLPDYIASTGISTTRQAVANREDGKSLKSLARERMNPKLHKFDIDLELLAKAFDHVTKPDMTSFGDVYYEGKEHEIKLGSKVPGKLSEDLRTALGLSSTAPPPWLPLMQKYGPPRSYPGLPVPGVNSSIPAGCSFGNEPGQWGMLPTDRNGNPLFGFITVEDNDTLLTQEGIDTVTLWGSLPEQEEEEDNNEIQLDEDEEEEEVPKEQTTEQTNDTTTELPQDISMNAENIPLRKGDQDAPLYVELEQRPTSNKEDTVMRGAYDLVVPQANKNGEVIVNILPDEFDNLTKEDLQIKVDQALEEKKKKKSLLGTGKFNL